MMKEGAEAQVSAIKEGEKEYATEVRHDEGGLTWLHATGPCTPNMLIATRCDGPILFAQCTCTI